MQREQIGSRQFALLVFLFTLGTAVVSGPYWAMKTVAQDGWVVVVLSILLGFLLISLYSGCASFMRYRNLVECAQFALGKWLGSLCSLAFVVFLIVLASLVLINMGQFLITRILPGTPIVPAEFMFVGIAVFAARLGLEVLSRATEMLLPFFLMLYLFFTIGLLPQVQVNEILPILEHSWMSIFESTFYFTMFVFGESMVFLMVIPYVQQKKIKRRFITGAMLGGILLLILILLSIFVLGPRLTVINTYPSYTLAKMIDIGGFFQRVEVIMAGIWFITIFVKLTILIWIAAKSIREIFQLREEQMISIPIGILIVPLSLWLTPNASTYMTSIKNIIGITAFVFMLFPFLIVAIAWVKMKFFANKRRA